jgi:hypothetical protein
MFCSNFFYELRITIYELIESVDVKPQLRICELRLHNLPILEPYHFPTL